MKYSHTHYLVLLMVMITLLTGCASQKDAVEGKVVETTINTSVESQIESTLTPGDTVANFTLESAEESSLLSSRICTFSHEKSGAKLVWIKNDDPELAFGIYYHTPMVDETDTNHVFEHAIIASSDKYPSKDIFFDMYNKSYNTFINAFTYTTFTGYPVSSMSEDQLLKMMDVYLSCMVAPTILTDENIFKREAIRYELYDKDEPITILGTVFAEDYGFLSDVYTEADNNTLDALYPGEYTANSIGRAHRNYQNLTYENTLATYERCYSFDNSLIYLYGDMDYERVLTFIDEEYLSHAEKKNIDLSKYVDGMTEPGYVEKTFQSPAYKGDSAENASAICYAIDLTGESWEDLIGWDFITNCLNSEQSSFTQRLRKNGITNYSHVLIDLSSAKPNLQFDLYDAEEVQNQLFKAIVDETLADIALNGIDQTLYDATRKKWEFQFRLMRDSQNVGINIAPTLISYWTHTGKTDVYNLYEVMIDQLAHDDQQTFFKSLAQDVVHPRRSALVTTVPTPGLAEELAQAQEDYLDQMKANMSDAELDQMIADTAAFNQWNKMEFSNNDFMIAPADIPDKEPFTDYTKVQQDGITMYLSESDIQQIGLFKLYLDASAISNEDAYYLSLYQMLLGELGTKDHTAEEIANLLLQYTYGRSTDVCYPNVQAKENHFPMATISWYSGTEDYSTAIDLLMEIMSSTDFSDTEQIKNIISKKKSSFDQSKGDDFSLANLLARSYFNDQEAYNLALQGQGFYRFLLDTEVKLAQDETYGIELAKKLQGISEKLLVRGRINFIAVAPQLDLDSIKEITLTQLNTVPFQTPTETSFILPERVQRTAVIVESSIQNTVQIGTRYDNEMFKGRYAPFLAAVSDRYIIPKARFQMGAYSAESYFDSEMVSPIVYTYSDPNVGKTLQLFEGIEDYLKGADLSQSDLDGYILSTLGFENRSYGELSQRLKTLDRLIAGYDDYRITEIINDMKHATIADQQMAAECLGETLAGSGLVTVGNEKAIMEDKDLFDKVEDYRIQD